jgi:hypothetical protein
LINIYQHQCFQPPEEIKGIAMHDLNNVLHMIGPGVYHASTQIGEDVEWAYGFCEMLGNEGTYWWRKKGETTGTP